jgi:TolB-like protein
MSGDRDQEYFSDGITDDLTTALSRLPDLFVIARTSAFTYKGKAAKVQDIGRELGVAYVLEGSVRKADNQVRITAQLVDAASGEHLWAEHYDRPLKNIFSLQDEIVRRIVMTLNLQLGLWDKYGLLVTKRTDSLEAYDDFLRGLEYAQSATKAGNEQAQRLYQKATELDANYSDAFAHLSFTYLLDWGWQWSHDVHDLDRALELGQHATALDDTQSLAHALLGATYLFKRQHDQALAEGQRAIDLDANFAPAYFWMAETLVYSGKPAEAVGMAQKAMRLDPRNQDLYLREIGRAYNRMGRYAEAVPVLKRYLARYPNQLAGHAALVITYVELGRDADGRAEVAEILRISPGASVEGFKKINPDIDRNRVEHVLEDLRKAGLK